MARAKGRGLRTELRAPLGLEEHVILLLSVTLMLRRRVGTGAK